VAGVGVDPPVDFFLRSPNPAPVAPLVQACPSKPPTRPAGKSNCLSNPLGQAGEQLGPSGFVCACHVLILAILLLIFCMPGGARATAGSVFKILTSSKFEF
jgi:hypothetical protein